MSADDLKPIGKPVDWDELYEGRFLKAGQLKGQKVTLTIESVDMYMLEGKKGPEKKGVLAFKERPKLISLNKINGLCLRAMFGRDVTQWEGKRITIFPDVVKEAGAMQGDLCIRIWGSPEIAHDLDVPIQLRKRKPYTLTMHKVVAGGGSKAAPTQAPPADEPREPGGEG
jgi:hypothetical protein